MRFKNRAGMIRSVSTSARSRGTTTPVCCVNGFISRSPPGADVDEVPRDRGGRRHGRTHEVRAAARPLPPLEVAVGGRRTPLAGAENIGIHAEAHRAPGLPPLKARTREESVESLALGRR